MAVSAEAAPNNYYQRLINRAAAVNFLSRIIILIENTKSGPNLARGPQVTHNEDSYTRLIRQFEGLDT